MMTNWANFSKLKYYAYKKHQNIVMICGHL